jgi:hypothetical protein
LTEPERNMTRNSSQSNSPIPRFVGGAFASYLGPDRLVPIDGQITLVGAKVAIRTVLRMNRPGPSTIT